ncbi:MAG: nicotinate-nucleotide pyrophosphorylase (carboxylating) [Halieaceae bacterium]|jgi:nicotinate-nucleotide pyrophosphorylase (carboxylating)
MNTQHPDQDEISAQVSQALAEDIGTGDITAALIPEQNNSRAVVISRDSAIICGRSWVAEVFRQLDSRVELDWHLDDGQSALPGQTIFTLNGNTRSILTGERTALNFLQFLSGTATVARAFADAVAGTDIQLLDTRKTIPGYRRAQKYAVRCGGCQNHRMGLFDAFLIKENHIAGCGSIAAAIAAARAFPGERPVEIEVESLNELKQALTAGADTVMLDNFSLQLLREAVAIRTGSTRLEASGNISWDYLTDIAKTGVDYISIGALTKDCKAIDFSMRLQASAADG